MGSATILSKPKRLLQLSTLGSLAIVEGLLAYSELHERFTSMRRSTAGSVIVWSRFWLLYLDHTRPEAGGRRSPFRRHARPAPDESRRDCSPGPTGRHSIGCQQSRGIDPMWRHVSRYWAHAFLPYRPCYRPCCRPCRPATPTAPALNRRAAPLPSHEIMSEVIELMGVRGAQRWPDVEGEGCELVARS